ncbi:MAG: hypothetical protein ABR600_09170 [Actinomycetota bacterium]
MVEDVIAGQEASRRRDDDAKDRFGSVIAHLIVVASIASAVVSWQASVFSNSASDLDQAASQQLVQREQLLAWHRGDVNEDLRLVSTFQEHVRNWRVLQAQSRRISDPAQSARLRRQADTELATARSLQRFFVVNGVGLNQSRSGDVAYSPRQAMQRVISQDLVLQALTPQATDVEAGRAHADTVRLEGIAAIEVLSLFFLTIAQIGRRRIRDVFSVVGSVVLLAGVGLFAAVEMSAR